MVITCLKYCKCCVLFCRAGIQSLLFRFICLGKKMSMQNRLFSICVGNLVIGNFTGKKKMPMENRLSSIFSSKMIIYIGKMLTYLGKMIFLYYYLLSDSKLQWQIKLILKCLYFLITNNPC